MRKEVSQGFAIGAVAAAVLTAGLIWARWPAAQVAPPATPAPVAAADPVPPPVAAPPVPAANPVPAPSAVSPAARSDAATPRATKPAAPPDEAHLMAHLRQIKDAEPARAVELAREGNRRFPDSADAPERTSILIHALAAQGLSSEARGEAERMVNHYPDSSWVREAEAFTGAHRHRNVRVNDAGQLEYY